MLVDDVVRPGLQDYMGARNRLRRFGVNDLAADSALKRRSGFRPTLGRFARFVPFIEETRRPRVVNHSKPEFARVRAQAASASDDLFERHNRRNRFHKNYVADARSVNAGRQKVNRRRHNRCGALSILEFLKQGFPGRSLLGYDPHRVVGNVQIGIEAVQLRTDSEGMLLIDAEDHGLFHTPIVVKQPIQVATETNNVVRHGDSPLKNRGGRIDPPRPPREGLQVRRRRDDVLDDNPVPSEIGNGAVDFICCEKAIINTLAEGINKDRIAKILVGVYVLGSFRGRGHAKLDRLIEVLEDGIPCAEAGSVTFIDDNHVKEVTGILLKEALPVNAGIHSLIDVK